MNQYMYGGNFGRKHAKYQSAQKSVSDAMVPIKYQKGCG